MKYEENVSGGSHCVSCVRTDGRTDRHNEIFFYSKTHKTDRKQRVCDSVKLIPLAQDRNCLAISFRHRNEISDFVEDKIYTYIN